MHLAVTKKPCVLAKDKIKTLSTDMGLIHDSFITRLHNSHMEKRFQPPMSKAFKNNFLNIHKMELKELDLYHIAAQKKTHTTLFEWVSQK